MVRNAGLPRRLVLGGSLLTALLPARGWAEALYFIDPRFGHHRHLLSVSDRLRPSNLAEGAVDRREQQPKVPLTAEHTVGQQWRDEFRVLQYSQTTMPPSRSCRVAQQSRAQQRPPLWWIVAAVVCWLLVVGGFVATLAGAGVGLIALGFPGAIGMIGLGLWLRQKMGREARHEGESI